MKGYKPLLMLRLFCPLITIFQPFGGIISWPRVKGPAYGLGLIISLFISCWQLIIVAWRRFLHCALKHILLFNFLFPQLDSGLGVGEFLDTYPAVKSCIRKKWLIHCTIDYAAPVASLKSLKKKKLSHSTEFCFISCLDADIYRLTVNLNFP